ncbi:MAG TPA: 2-amino-4-hydroxy-6-hydroxymethyldihydropteridine diphosphokinase [Actinomycetales bacterium]|nr:2-amino-4-hydroxy-6-hydroxymethyldihydropteridine diphosphokinase [Actinomycetales bacterium]
MTSPVRPVDLDAAPAHPVDAVVALGSNLGDRMASLQAAVDSLAAEPGLQVVAVSPVVETDPVGGPEQDDYLNAVVVVRCSLSPRELLRACQRAEAQRGRERLVRWGPRTLDVDLVSFDGLVSSDRGPDPELVVPHPRASQRAFVLQPWSKLDPAAVLAGPDGGPVSEFAERAPDAAGVRQRPDLRLRLPTTPEVGR